MSTEQQSGHSADLDNDAVVQVVDIEKGAPAEFEEIVLKVGPGGGRSQRFFGRQVGESRQITKEGVESVRVYLSRKGKYVVHRQQSDWSDFSMLGNWINDWKNWRSMIGLGDQDWGDFTVDVVDSIEDLRELVPAKTYRSIADVALNPRMQDLDI
ncbi:EXLDI protein [Nocardia sp. NPDC050710]|uniref:EXLDI protein n=1 Tax=Nocardia sp. NPDC050710 TaxID=3157220 RepID=UPI0033CC1676